MQDSGKGTAGAYSATSGPLGNDRLCIVEGWGLGVLTGEVSREDICEWGLSLEQECVQGCEGKRVRPTTELGDTRC